MLILQNSRDLSRHSSDGCRDTLRRADFFGGLQNFPRLLRSRIQVSGFTNMSVRPLIEAENAAAI
jgi:hypothetical protein